MSNLNFNLSRGDTYTLDDIRLQNRVFYENLLKTKLEKDQLPREMYFNKFDDMDIWFKPDDDLEINL